MKVTLNVNGQSRSVDVDPRTPLVWVLRDELDLKGTKFGCGMALCGACTVHIDGNPVRSCSMPISAIKPTQKIVTIEGRSHRHEVQWRIEFEYAIDQEFPACELVGGFDGGRASPEFEDGVLLFAVRVVQSAVAFR